MTIDAPEGKDGVSRNVQDAMAAGSIVAYFGYGSLVNRHTLRTSYIDAQPARLTGWRRCWRPSAHWVRHKSKSPASMLSARPHPDQVIDGLLVYDTLENLPSVDQREAAYERVQVAPNAIQLNGRVPQDCPIYIYEAHTNRAPHDPEHPIIQSYLDAVLQGFMHEFGESGVHDFIHSTDGFERPVLKDRHDPIYQRAVDLPEHQRSYFDDLLSQKGVTFV